MNKKFRIVSFLLILLSLLLIPGCGKTEDIGTIDSLDDLYDKELKIGYPDDLNLTENINELCPKAKTYKFAETDVLSAFNSKKIDAYACNENLCKYIIEQSNGTLQTIDTPITAYPAVFATSDTSQIPDLEKKVDEFIAKGQNEGLFKEITTRWLDPNSDETMHEVPTVKNPKYTLRVGTVGFNKPYCYYKNNELTGADIEIVYHLAAYLNAKVEFEDSNYNSIIAGITTGKYDLLAACIFYTPERAESINCSDPYTEVNIKLIVPKNSIKLADLNGKTAGVMTGTPHVEMIEKVVDDASYEYFNSFSDLALALEQNKIDFFVNNKVAFKLMKEEYPDFISVEEPICSFDIGTIFPKDKDNQELINQYNEYIQKIKADGTLDELENYWLDNNDWQPLDLATDGENGTLTLATCTSNKPYSLMVDGVYSGFDVAVVNGFCKEYGYALKIEDCDFASMLAGITTGKYDFAAGQIAYTDERAENVIYSDFYTIQHIVAILKDSTTDESNTSTIWDNLCAGFKKTFIDEDRYLLILSGIKVTLIITVLGFILANILGALLCAMTMSKLSILKIIANVYSKIMQGTPIVVVLMIIYYVIFGKSSISNILVAILAFGLSTATYIAQIFEGAISQVAKGEIEAALALGLTHSEVFFGITLPQALRFCITPLGSQLVALMKGTAIVGYIAVMDMTKVSDIIRSSTYEAFFPLLSTALIYFLISTIILLIFDKLRLHMDPANKKRKMKGV